MKLVVKKSEGKIIFEDEKQTLKDLMAKLNPWNNKLKMILSTGVKVVLHKKGTVDVEYNGKVLLTEISKGKYNIYYSGNDPKYEVYHMVHRVVLGEVKIFKTSLYMMCLEVLEDNGLL